MLSIAVVGDSYLDPGWKAEAESLRQSQGYFFVAGSDLFGCAATLEVALEEFQTIQINHGMVEAGPPRRAQR